LLSEAKVLIFDDLIRTYGENARQTGKFTLQSGSGEFLLDGKIINDLYYVFEAKSGHQACNFK
jgi:hypothetical protein